jgi:SAM-dependent methyltransferase
MGSCLKTVGAALLAATLTTAALFVPVAAAARDDNTSAEYKPQVGQPGKDVVWVPTPDEVVQKMLDMAQVKAGERVVDLGSGDGKIAIAAAKRGAKARGIEYNPKLVELSRRNARDAGVTVDFRQGDIFKSDFRDADVVTLYLLPSLNERLRPILLKMKPGTRVTSHQFMMGDWQPDETASLAGRQAHLWIVPARLQGRWQLSLGDAGPVTLDLTQNHQMLTGQARIGDRSSELSDARVRGNQVVFTLADPNGNGGSQRFEGRLSGRNRLAGEAVGADGRRIAFIAVRQ